MRKNILVADDNPVIRKAVCRLIEEDERLAPCLVAENGLQAVEVAMQAKPDLVIMDFSMPLMNGLDASKRIKEILPHVPIILLSLYMVTPTSEEMAELGIAKQIPKERAGAELIPTVVSLLRLPSVI
jgi:DNA-binding NarL/FixJ family response regulator